MGHFDKFSSRLAPFVMATVVAACGDTSGPKGDPEVEHCTRAAQRLTRDVGPIRVLETKASTAEDVRSVRVRFAYAEDNPAGLTFGAVACGYAFPVTVRGDAKRIPQAQSVYFRARNLSENELLLLNMGLRGTYPEYKIK